MDAVIVCARNGDDGNQLEACSNWNDSKMLAFSFLFLYCAQNELFYCTNRFGYVRNLVMVN